jgi:IS6 family transposase
VCAGTCGTHSAPATWRRGWLSGVSQSITRRFLAGCKQTHQKLEKRCRPQLKVGNGSWKVDETSIKIKKVWMSLYRAVDSEGNTLEFLLSPTRDAEAAKGIFLKALGAVHTSTPRVINVDKNAASPKAMSDLKVAGVLPRNEELRQVKYLNNLIEQDHRYIKRWTKPGMGFFSFETAWRTFQGFEMRNKLRKGQVQGVAKGEVRGQVTLIARRFGVARYVEQSEPLPPHCLFLQFLATQPCYVLSNGSKIGHLAHAIGEAILDARSLLPYWLLVVPAQTPA